MIESARPTAAVDGGRDDSIAPVKVIAEAGVNHNGSLDLALELVDAAAEAGADIVKFQTFRADAMVCANAPKATYQLHTTDAAESQHAMLRALELDEAMHRRIIERCAARGIEFLSTPFDEQSLELLVSMGLRRLKIPSGEITNGPLLIAAARTGLPIILSTGMSDLNDVATALGAIGFGYVEPADARPSAAAFRECPSRRDMRHALAARVTLLHCTTEYPALFDDVNLRAMDTLAATFGTPVGYSDHTPGISIPVAAVARGARVIEKHMTLDRSLEGPDHQASLEPGEIRAMITAIREVERALGRPEKQPAVCELANREIVRKSLVANTAIRRGEVFSAENVAAKRPAVGRSPMELWDIIGEPATCDYAPGQPIA